MSEQPPPASPTAPGPPPARPVRVSPGMALALALALVPTVGLLDGITGHEVSFSIFYLIPVSIAAWFGTRMAAVAMAFLAGCTWLVAEQISHPAFSQAWIPYWNATVRTVFFLLGAAWLSAIRRRNARLQAEVERQTAALREEVAQRRHLEREVAEVTAREQARIARDLHDGVGQYLAGLSFHARVLADDLAREGSSHAAEATRLVEQINQTNRQTRRLDAILSPPVGEAGLAAALRQLVSEVEQFAGVRCELDVPEAAPPLDAFQALNLFRIAQEAINNAIKHGDASTVRVELAPGPADLRLRISDQGKGLPRDAGVTAGAGLRIMRHRAELIGAALELRAGEPAGCVVECHLPLAPTAVLS